MYWIYIYLNKVYLQMTEFKESIWKQTVLGSHFDCRIMSLMTSTSKIFLLEERTLLSYDRAKCPDKPLPTSYKNIQIYFTFDFILFQENSLKAIFPAIFLQTIIFRLKYFYTHTRTCTVYTHLIYLAREFKSVLAQQLKVLGVTRI